MRVRCSLAVLAAVFGGMTVAAVAQEASFDAKALDANVSTTPKAKGKKGRAKPDAAAAAPQKGGKPPQNRQFGELEGWSPGKAPPRRPDDPDPTPASPGKSAPVSVTPQGGMSVGLPF